jgi:formylglycine-generating enzyme required for sulfatase activity
MLKKIVILLSMFSISVYGAVALSNVKIKQRYPWNGKVDISFDLSSTRNNNAVRITALNTATGLNLNMRMVYDENGNQLVAPFKMGPGSHRIVWDADKDVEGGFNNHVALSISAGPYSERPLYMVVDLSGGVDAVDFPVEYLDAVPEGGWTREHKTTKLVLRLIQPGTFMMGPGPDAVNVDGMGRETLHQVTLTKPFYIGVFEVTQKQWLCVMGAKTIDGNWKEGEEYDDFSVPLPRYTEIRGEELRWPLRTVSEGCFMYVLRKKTNIRTFDLPTEAQWEYACRAGTTTSYNHGTDKWDDRYNTDLVHMAVGSKSPNAWGLYDFNSGAAELVGDFWTWNLGVDPVIDPMGSASDTFMVTRGHHTVSHSRYVQYPDRYGVTFLHTFRVAVHLD